jgi:hypothetical protein
METYTMASAWMESRIQDLVGSRATSQPCKIELDPGTHKPCQLNCLIQPTCPENTNQRRGSQTATVLYSQ